MTTNRLVAASFRHYWRSHLGLLFGAFLASAVLSGSLLVGDSVRTSLRRAAAERLGKVEGGLLGGDRWFTGDLARKSQAVPVIMLRGSVSESSGRARSNAVQVLGVNEEFFKLSPHGASLTESKNSLAINESLARRLDVFVGDTVLVRLEKPSAISRDAPLSGEANQDITLRRKITAILSGDDFGNFQLQATPTAPDNVFVPLPELAELLGKKGKVNGILDSGISSRSRNKYPAAAPVLDADENPGSAQAHAFSQRILLETISGNVSLEDFSLKLSRLAASSENPPSAIRRPSSEWELTSDRIFLDDIVAQKILKAVPGSRGVLTYLVNGLSSTKERVPYSMVCGTDLRSVSPSGILRGQASAGEKPTLPPSQQPVALLPDDSAIINQWLADDLQLSVGDKFDLRYFSVGLGRDLKEQTASFTVRGILPMNDPAVNPSWAPDFPGVTDAKNCRDWQPGIPMKLDTIRDKDEDYWKQFKTTPKAFISLVAAQKLWSNRFGNLTGIRFPDSGQDVNKLREELVKNLRLADIGLVPRDFRAEAEAAAKGSVDFGGLFAGLSLFLIAAALIFSSLLFVFTLEMRATHIGLLFALGWREKQVRRLILSEAGLIALIGTALGLLGGMAYTKIAILGLNGIWSGATAGMRLVHNFAPLTLLIAFVISVVASLGTIWLASRRIFKARAKDLLAGDAWVDRPQSTAKATASSKWSRAVRALPVFLLLLTIVLSLAGSRATDPEAIAGMFFGSGFCLLTAGLILIRRRLQSLDSHPASRIDQAASLSAFGFRNITRRPGRSLSVIGMMAGGIFLVIAVNAFRIGAESDTSKRSSGTGGFALIGESTLPIYEDLNSEAGREAFALDDKLMKDVRVVPFRVREGDDASCLNLNKAQSPTLCGVNPRLLAERGAFSFAKGSWDGLVENPKTQVLAIADQATAMWGLGKGIGDSLIYSDAQGREFKVTLVALLGGSVFQGKVIVSEQNFLSKFPDAAGYKFFLIDAPVDKATEVGAHLTRQLQARGLALETTAARLNAFNAVQNTYIGIFTVLGGLGVLLGTFGLGVLAMRNVLERRGEFGLMQALGFRAGALRRMVLDEHAALLVIGLLLGLVCAAIAVWPNIRGGSDLPLGFLFAINAAILIFGVVVCWLAAVLALRGRLLDAVRKE